MSPHAKREQVIGLVSRLCGKAVTPATRLSQDLGLSASQISLLLFRIEHDLHIIFPDALIANAQLSLRQIIDFVEYH
jgi:acyl carrier protein